MMTSSYFKYKNSQIHYEIAGQGQPLLFIQGLLWDKNIWRSQFEYFCSYYQCVVVELWEHGLSDHIPSQTYALEDLADDVWQLTRHLNLDNFAIIGFSIGGTIAVHMALAHPNSVISLILLSTTLSEERDNGRQIYAELMSNVEKSGMLSSETVSNIVDSCLCTKTKEDFPMIKQEIRELLEAIPTANIKGMFTLCRAAIDRSSLLDKLHALGIPTLLMVGQEENPLLLKETQLANSKIKNCQIVIVPATAHLLMVEQPDIVRKVLMKYLNKYIHQNRGINDLD